MSILTSVLVCPVCKGPLLKGNSDRHELVCPSCELAYEIVGEIPCMIASRARPLNDEEKVKFKDMRDKSQKPAK